MKKYVNLPIEKLVSDVTVDPIHVRELADSIMVSGPIAPVLVREESSALIDGFHRVAAMKELGFREVECLLTSCDDETFWDLRIMSASLHKAVTFARVVDWIEEVFRTSPWAKRYNSAYSLFGWVRTRDKDYDVPKEAREWVEQKAKKWGLSVQTMENWLYTKQKLAPDLVDKAKLSPTGREGPSFSHYRAVAETLPNRQDLQREALKKADEEELSQKETRTLAQALRRAEDKEEIQNILRQPISRTEDQMVRDAKVEKLLSHPREVTPLEKWQEAKHEDVLYKLDLLGIINSTRAMTQEKISALTPEQKADVYHTCEEAIAEIQRIMDMIRSTTAEYLLKEG